MNQPDIIIKAILIGDAGVGKTSLAKKLTNANTRNDEISTIGVDFFNLDAIINKKKKLECTFGILQVMKNLFIL